MRCSRCRSSCSSPRWALYAESLGRELGLFTDPYSYYGRLSDEMLRAMRLVVDTGIHAKGWSREEAIDYMLEHFDIKAFHREILMVGSLPLQILRSKVEEWIAIQEAGPAFLSAENY